MPNHYVAEVNIDIDDYARELKRTLDRIYLPSL